MQDAFGLEQVVVSTYQAVSGAGYPGVPSLDILGNVVPHIKGEEEKMEAEILKMLGKLRSGKVADAKFEILASCARVPVINGHLESVVVRCTKDPKAEAGGQGDARIPRRASEAGTAHSTQGGDHRPGRTGQAATALGRGCWRAGEGQGHGVTVGRIRKKDKYVKFFLLSHNTLRGGAGGSVLNAELAFAKGILK